MAVLRIERCRLPATMEFIRAKWQIRLPERYRNHLLHSVFEAGSFGERRLACFAAEESPWSHGSKSGANEVHNDSVHKDSPAGHAFHGQSGQQSGLAAGLSVAGEAQLLLAVPVEGECPSGL